MDELQSTIEYLAKEIEYEKRVLPRMLRGRKTIRMQAFEIAISAMQELQEYREIGTVNKCAGYKIHSQSISKLHNCNDCGKRNNCEILPGLGGYCRINCHLWEEKQWKD